MPTFRASTAGMASARYWTRYTPPTKSEAVAGKSQCATPPTLRAGPLIVEQSGAPEKVTQGKGRAADKRCQPAPRWIQQRAGSRLREEELRRQKADKGKRNHECQEPLGGARKNRQGKANEL